MSERSAAPALRAALALALLAGALYVAWSAIDHPRDTRPLGGPAPPEVASRFEAASSPPLERRAEAAPGLRPELQPTVLRPREIQPRAPGASAPSPIEAFCDEQKWKKVGLDLARNEAGDFLVEREAWIQRSTSARVGLASWMSQCQLGGETVTILARRSGDPLATYDAATGYRSLAR